MSRLHAELGHYVLPQLVVCCVVAAHCMGYALKLFSAVCLQWQYYVPLPNEVDSMGFLGFGNRPYGLCP